MSEKIVDIGTQSTVEKILDKFDTNIGFSTNISNSTDVNDLGGIFSVGAIPSGSSCAMFTYDHNLYIVPDESDTVYVMTNDRRCWKKVFKLPFEVNVSNTRLLVYDNPISETTELHILGGYGRLSKVHFRYDLKNNGGISIASDLPYDFCAGKAIVFKNEIHIFGGGTSEFSTKNTVPSDFLNNHYKWNGTSWQRASNLAASCYGATPFVCNDILHLIGGYNSDTGRAVYSFNPSTKTWISRTIDEPSGYIVQNPSITVISNNAYILGGVYNNNIKIQVGNSSPSTIPVLDTNLSFPTNNSTNSQCLVELDGTLYTNIDIYIYSQNYASGGNCNRYMTVNESIENAIPIIKYNSNGKKCLSLALLGDTGKKFIDMDNDITESVNFSMSSGIATNDNGDIYMFSDTSIKTNALAYIKKMDEEGRVTYKPISFKLSKEFTNPLVAWYNNKFHIISNSDVYNHYLISNYNSSLEPATVFPGTLNSSMSLNAICVFGDSMYVATIYKDDSSGIERLKLYSLTNNKWTCIADIPIGGTEYPTNTISMLSYQNRLNVFANNARGYITWCILNNGTLRILDNSEYYSYYGQPVNSKFIVHNGLLQSIGTDSSGVTSRIVYMRHAMGKLHYHNLYGDGKCDIIWINLDKGRRIICNKDDIIPMSGYVLELENGYEAMDSGLYALLHRESAIYTLT